MLYYFLIILFYLCFLYLAAKNLKNGLYLICALLPTYLIRFSIFGLPATLLEGMIVILFIVWLVKEKVSLNPLVWIKNIKEQKTKNKEQNNTIPKSLRLPLILLLVAATVSVFTAPNFQAAAGLWKAYFIEPLMFFLIFVYNIKTTDEIQKVIRYLGITALAIGIFAVIQKFSGVLIPNPFWADEATRRITTFFGYPNANALFLMPVLFLTIGNIFLKIKNYKLIENWKLPRPARSACGVGPGKIGNLIIDLLILVLGVLSVIWTRSASALIALAVGLIFLLIFHKKIKLVTLLILLIVSIYAVASPVVQQKIQKIYVSVNEINLPTQASDFQIRAQQWRETLAMLKDTPIFGAGLAGYQTLVAPYHQNKHIEIYLYPHNFFLNFWTETGLLGLISIIWIIIIFFTLASSVIQNSRLTSIIISSMIALLVQGLVDVPYFKNDLSVLFWIIIGIAIVLNNLWRGARVVESGALEKR